MYDIKDSVLSGLMRDSLLIGSRYLGLNTNDSDYDICMHISYYQEVVGYIDRKGIEIVCHEDSGGENILGNFCSSKFKLDGIEYNIIGYTHPEWKKFTLMINSILMQIIESPDGNSALSDRYKRYRITEGLYYAFFGVPSWINEARSLRKNEGEPLSFLFDDDIPF